jgi:hypothetical protein
MELIKGFDYLEAPCKRFNKILARRLLHSFPPDDLLWEKLP